AIFSINLNALHLIGGCLHQRLFDQPIPAAVWNRYRAVLLLLSADTANDEPLPGARHGDIEQAAVLILVRSQDTLACVCDGGRIARLVPGPDNRLRPIQRYRDELRRMMPGRPGGRVGENDGGSLKPFGA